MIGFAITVAIVLTIAGAAMIISPARAIIILRVGRELPNDPLAGLWFRIGGIFLLVLSAILLITLVSE